MEAAAGERPIRLPCELSKAERIDRAYLGKMLPLKMLAPDIVETFLHGQQLADLDAEVETCAVKSREQRCGMRDAQGFLTVVHSRICGVWQLGSLSISET